MMVCAEMHPSVLALQSFARPAKYTPPNKENHPGFSPFHGTSYFHDGCLHYGVDEVGTSVGNGIRKVMGDAPSSFLCRGHEMKISKPRASAAFIPMMSPLAMVIGT